MTSNSNKFPVKLYNILQEAETTPHLADIVSWLPDGKSFKVHEKDEFSKSILPATFGTNVYKSFQRNLHFWGYRSIRKGPSKGECSHPFFVRDSPELLCKMRRVRAPGKGNDDGSAASQHINLVEAETTSPTTSKKGIPSFVFAGPGPGSSTERMAVSPSQTSTESSSHRAVAFPEQPASLHIPSLDASGNGTAGTAALLLMLQQRQQQEQQQHRQQEDLKNTEQDLNNQMSLEESILVRQWLVQHEQQQQQKLLQDLLVAHLIGHQHPQQHQGLSSVAMDQGALAQALLSQVLQQQEQKQQGGPNPAANLLALSTMFGR